MSTLSDRLREYSNTVAPDLRTNRQKTEQQAADELDRLTALSETHRVAAVHATQKCHELDAEISRLVEDKSRLTARVAELEKEKERCAQICEGIAYMLHAGAKWYEGPWERFWQAARKMRDGESWGMPRFCEGGKIIDAAMESKHD